MKQFFYFLFGFMILFTSSCDLLNNVDDALSDDEIVQGLKTALEVGTDSSATVLSAVDGYYGDDLVKILLPPEAEPMLNYVSIIESIAGSDYVENTIKSINRSAEDAASEAKPIFVDAITGMSIQDGLNILQGKSSNKSDFDSIAATNYLIANTYTSLVGVYAPKIDAALEVDQLGIGFTTNELWNSIVFAYNLGVSTFLINEEPIDDNLTLGEYSTGKALDGLFFKIGEEEKKIRKNPWDWALDIIHKVFGSVHEG
jgi:hypothetical protein